MSIFRAEKEGSKIVLQRLTKKGERKNYLALVDGPGTGDFKLNLKFLGAEEQAKPTEFEKEDGVNTAVETFEVEPDSMFQTAIKGERAQFFTVNSKGQVLALERRDVHEAVGVEWEDRRAGE